MSLQTWRESVHSPRFALVDFFLVAISGALLCLFPELWGWSLLIALIPWGFRLVTLEYPFQPTGIDWMVAGFALTASAGYWASYDQPAAFTKCVLIIASTLLYFALRAQPASNLAWISVALFCVGLGVSVYFLLTHDFIESPRRLEFVNSVGRWSMQVRPSFGWEPIHPNYVSGIAAMTAPFILYPLWLIRRTTRQGLQRAFIYAALSLVFAVMIMTTSRGVFMAVASAVGIWIMWWLLPWSEINARLGKGAVFPSLVFFFLIVVVAFLYWGPATVSDGAVDTDYYGDSSRAEVFARSAYLVADFPFTGGGLEAYPGLYSQYMLVIPHTYLPNAHNVFLDVFIEQGIPGGLLFIFLFVLVIWQLARVVVSDVPAGMQVFGWIALASTIMVFVHGMVDDYLYNGKGTILLLLPLSVAAIPIQSSRMPESKPGRFGQFALLLLGILAAVSVLISRDRLMAAWDGNLGAVQMAQIELAGFPTGKWTEAEILPALAPAEASLLASIEADPVNRTANHRLGLIALLRQDFSSAAKYLETAHAVSPGHRGIVKSLGYCYVWLGEYEKANGYLLRIPEAESELNIYIGWWKTQGRSDLSEHAAAMSKILSVNAETVTP